MSILEHAIPIAGQEPFDPRLLIDRVSASFPGVYSKGVGVSQGYTLAEHTLMVLGQYEKYFSGSPLPAGLDHSHFRLFLAIHDLGKPKAVEEGNKHRQGEYNPVLFEEHFPGDPFIGEKHRLLLWSLLKGDPVGNLIKRGERELDRVLEELESMYGHTTDVARKDYMDILLMYYMADAGSYTRDAGPKSGLDHLFHFYGSSMDFSTHVKPIVRSLSERFINNNQGFHMPAHENSATFYDHAMETSFGIHYVELTQITLAAVRRHLRAGSILDYGAGTGRLSIPLTRGGYQVTAVEISPAMAERLTAKAEAAGLQIPVHANSISNYRNGRADMALCVFTVLSYITEDGEFRDSLVNMCEHLNPGGLLFLDLPNDVFFNQGVLMNHQSATLQRRVTLHPSHGNLYDYREVCRGVWLGEEYSFEENFPLRKWTWPELNAALRGSGMSELPDRFQEFAGTGSTYRMFRKA